MSFRAMRTQTESILAPGSGYMEFDLAAEAGYREWCGLFAELGVKATLFNGYMLQSQSGSQISTTPVQLHTYPHSMFLAPPFEAQEYYFELPRAASKLGKVYFQISPEYSERPLDDYKPDREAMTAVDIWTQATDGAQTVYTLLYEARIQTDKRVYEITRFESEQLFHR